MIGKISSTDIQEYNNPDTPLAIALNTTTYTKLLDANEKRIGYKVSNLDQNTILIVEKVPDDDLDRGFVLFGRTVYESKDGSIPIGEIHAKALTGTPSVLATDESLID